MSAPATLPTAPDISRLLLLFTRFGTAHGFKPLGAAAVPDFAAQPGSSALLFADDPQKNPETWDVAVVLPDLVRAFAPQTRVGLLDPATASQHAPRYGVRQWPALVFLRDGDYLGAIARMRDWSEYATLIPQLLVAEPGPIPMVGA